MKERVTLLVSDSAEHNVKQGFFVPLYTTQKTRIVHKIPEESSNERFCSARTDQRNTKKFIPCAVCIVFIFYTSNLIKTNLIVFLKLKLKNYFS